MKRRRRWCDTPRSLMKQKQAVPQSATMAQIPPAVAPMMTSLVTTSAEGSSNAAGKVDLAAAGANKGRLGSGSVGGGGNGSIRGRRGGGGHRGVDGAPPSASPLAEPAIVIVGTVRIVTPSAVEGVVEGSAAMPRVEDSEACTAAAVVEASTAMVAVMITLAADTSMVTSDVSTPAAVATFCCRLEVSS